MEHSPYFEKNQHSGIFFKLYSCRNSQSSPFLQRPRNQCLQTTVFSMPNLFTASKLCFNGQAEPLKQIPRMYSGQINPDPVPSISRPSFSLTYHSKSKVIPSRALSTWLSIADLFVRGEPMSSRARNIRKKPSEESWDTEEDSSIKIQTRTVNKVVSSIEPPAEKMDLLILEDVQDRVFEVDDEHLLLEKRIQFAKEQRRMRRMESEDDFIPIKQTSVDSDLEEAAADEIGPLEMIAEMGVDEEVFEDLRKPTITFGLPTEGQIQEDLEYEEDEEFRAWEMSQIKKGMVSAGVKSDKEAKTAAKQIQKSAEISEQRVDLIDFESLDFYSADLMRNISNQEQLLEKSVTDMDNLQQVLSSVNLSDLEADVSNMLKRVEFYQSEIQYWTSYSSFVDEVCRAMDEKNIELASGLFEDCLPEYSSIDCVTERLSKWKLSYPEDYEHMFIESKIPFLLEMFVQRQLLTWNPFAEAYKNINELLQEIQETACLSDSNLQTLLKQVYIQRIFVIVTEAFKPADCTQTVRLKEILSAIAGIVGHENQDFALLKMVLSDIIESAKNDASPEELPRILQTQSGLGL